MKAQRRSNTVLAPIDETPMTVGDVARVMRCAPRTVHKLADSGAIECWRVGGDRRFNPSAVEGYMRRNGIPFRRGNKDGP